MGTGWVQPAAIRRATGDGRSYGYSNCGTHGAASGVYGVANVKPDIVADRVAD
jgi:hypothetical protein